MSIASVLWEYLVAPFVDFNFMRRAITGCIALSLGSSTLGILLLQRRMSLMGDAMSHAILPGAAIGYLLFGLSLPAMTIGGIIAGLLVAGLAAIVSRYTELKEDASFATFYLISLALGILIISLRGSTVDLLGVLFGTVLALDNATLILAAGIASLSLLLLALFYRPIVIQSLDPHFLLPYQGWNIAAYGVFLLLMVLNLVGGFHTLGTLMAVAFMILPAASARFWAATLPLQMLFACIFAIICSYIGLLISYHYAAAASPAIVLTLGCAYFISLLFGRHNGLLNKHAHVNNAQKLCSDQTDA